MFTSDPKSYLNSSVSTIRKEVKKSIFGPERFMRWLVSKKKSIFEFFQRTNSKHSIFSTRKRKSTVKGGGTKRKTKRLHQLVK